MKGKYYSGKDSSNTITEIFFENENPVFKVGDKIIKWEKKSVRISPPFRNSPLQIRKAEELLVIEEFKKEDLDFLLKKRNKILYSLESNSRLWILTSLSSILVLYAFFRYLVPVSSTFFVKMIPRNIGVMIDQKIWSSFKNSHFSESKLNLKLRTEVKDFLHSNTPKHMGDIDIKIRRMHGDIPNAFALSTKTVIISDYLIKVLKTKEELLAVYYHELGHLQEKHLLKSIFNTFLFSLAGHFIVGDIVGGADTIINIGVTLLGLSHSRDMETEADEKSAYFLKKNSLNSNCLGSALSNLKKYFDQDLEKFKEVESIINSKYLSGHPSFPERISMMSNINGACPKSRWSNFKY